MDQFDDLPDVVEKDDKPKFQTEVSNSGPSTGISNGLQPLFGDEASAGQKAVKDPDDQDDVAQADKHVQNSTSNNNDQ